MRTASGQKEEGRGGNGLEDNGEREKEEKTGDRSW